MKQEILRQAIGHAIFKHDVNLTDDLFIIHTEELDQLCQEAIDETRSRES